MKNPEFIDWSFEICSIRKLSRLWEETRARWSYDAPNLFQEYMTYENWIQQSTYLSLLSLWSSYDGEVVLKIFYQDNIKKNKTNLQLREKAVDQY